MGAVSHIGVKTGMRTITKGSRGIESTVLYICNNDIYKTDYIYDILHIHILNIG